MSSASYMLVRRDKVHSKSQSTSNVIYMGLFKQTTLQKNKTKNKAPNTYDDEAQFLVLLKDLSAVNADEASDFICVLLKSLNGFGECGGGGWHFLHYPVCHSKERCSR